MADWDADSPQLRRNLTDLLRRLRDEAPRRSMLDRETARRWQSDVMYKLGVPLPFAVGAFRGEANLANIEVTIGPHPGLAASAVHAALQVFEQRLQRAVALLDADIAIGASLDRDQLVAVLELCAWVHAEWIRIHPFANGNGRTARLWVNCIALRYGLPPFARLRPRPGGDYAIVGEAAMPRRLARRSHRFPTDAARLPASPMTSFPPRSNAATCYPWTETDTDALGKFVATKWKPEVARTP